MSSISYSELRQNLKKAILTVNEAHEPIYITNHKEPLVSYEDYRSMEETAYLLRSPKNAQRLVYQILDTTLIVIACHYHY